jgi:hypothetical protein
MGFLPPRPRTGGVVLTHLPLSMMLLVATSALTGSSLNRASVWQYRDGGQMEPGRPLWATCTRGKAPPPSVYQKEYQDQLMPPGFDKLLKERHRYRGLAGGKKRK